MSKIDFSKAKLINTGKQIDIEKVNRICGEALEKWGEPAQLHVMMEECAEFIVAVNHSFRQRKGCLDEIIEEAADVQICMWQMQMIISKMGLTDRFIEMVNSKLARMEERLNGRGKQCI